MAGSAGWGDVATWVAALATFAAVLAALFANRSSIKALERARSDELARAAAANEAKAQRLALVFDHEIHLVLGDLFRVCNALAPDEVLRNARACSLVASSLWPGRNLPLLTQFVADLDVFEIRTAAQLTLAVSRWQAFTEARFERLLEGDTGGATNQKNVLLVGGACSALADDLVAARRAIRPYAAKLRPDLPPIDR